MNPLYTSAFIAQPWFSHDRKGRTGKQSERSDAKGRLRMGAST